MWATTPHCSAALCGNECPAARQAASVSPEQSYPPGPSAPQMYGFPIAPYAKRTATPAEPAIDGTGPVQLPPEGSVGEPNALVRMAYSACRSLWLLPFAALRLFSGEVCAAQAA